MVRVAPRAAGFTQLLVVHEEERAVAAVETRQHHGPADVEARLFLQQIRLRQIRRAC